MTINIWPASAGYLSALVRVCLRQKNKRKNPEYPACPVKCEAYFTGVNPV